MKARTVVGRGEEDPLCDPGSELLLGGRQGEENSAKIIDGMKKNIKGKTTTCGLAEERTDRTNTME